MQQWNQQHRQTAKGQILQNSAHGRNSSSLAVNTFSQQHQGKKYHKQSSKNTLDDNEYKVLGSRCNGKKKSETMDTTSYYVKICVAVVVLLWIHSVMLGMYVCIFGGT